MLTPATLCEEGYCALLDALTDGLVVYAHLYTNDPDIDPDLTLEDMVEASFDGYAAGAVRQWTDAALDNAVAFSTGDPVTFQWAGTGTPPVVRGHYATMGADGPLIWAWRRPDDPFTFTQAVPRLIVNVELTFPPVVLPVTSTRRRDKWVLGE